MSPTQNSPYGQRSPRQRDHLIADVDPRHPDALIRQLGDSPPGTAADVDHLRALGGTQQLVRAGAQRGGAGLSSTALSCGMRASIASFDMRPILRLHVDMKSSATMSIGEAAGHFGLATHVLRHWETMGLLSPPRATGGRRRYERSDLYRVASVLLAKEAGLALALTSATS